MEQFCQKYEVPPNIRASIQDVITSSNVDFYSLDSNTLFTIFKDDVEKFPIFFSNYKVEKENQAIRSVEFLSEVTNTQKESLGENSTQSKNSSSIADSHQMELSFDDNGEDYSDDEEVNSVTQPNIDVEHSNHSSLPDEFQYNKNFLYWLLFGDPDGKIILAKYKNKKILLEKRLKQLIIKKIIIENLISYRIRAKRFEEIRSQIKELFPTLTEKQLDHWYTPRKRNVRGEVIQCSGALYNFYRVYRCELAETGLVTFKTKQNGASITEEPVADLHSLSNLTCLFDKEEGRYDVTTVSRVWDESFKTRMKTLIDSKNKAIQIRYATYLNTFGCLNRLFGLSLLLSDSTKIVENLYEGQKISKDAKINFQLCFVEKWPNVAADVCKIGDTLNTSDVKDFRVVHKDYLTQIPVEIRGLMYLPYLLSRATNIKTLNSENIKLQKKDIANHFIAFIEDESRLVEKKLPIVQELEHLGIDVHPFIIFCGQLPSVTKAYVVIKSNHFEFDDPLKAVDQCFRASVALHTWSKLLLNVWVFIQEYLYQIETGASIALIQKSQKVVDVLKDKIKEIRNSN